MPFGGRLDPCQGCRSEQETLIHKSSIFIPANSCASERSQKSKSEVEANAGKARLPIWPTLCATMLSFMLQRGSILLLSDAALFPWCWAFRKFGYFLQSYVQRGVPQVDAREAPA